MAFIACIGVRPAQADPLWSWQLQDSDCPGFYFERGAPIVVSTHDFGDLEEFCYRYFVVLHSTETRGAIWSAMLLTRNMSLRGDCINRQRVGFRVERSLPSSQRASSSDYRGHGADWEIGHMTPADDMPTIPTQKQTFVFSNAVPQAAELNSPTWATLENQIHNLAQEVSDGLYVVTGPVYANQTIRRLNHRVGIPTHIFKAVYDPSADRAIAFIAENRHDASVRQLSLSELGEDFGIVAFPRLPDRVRSNAEEWTLPERRNRECTLD